MLFVWGFFLGPPAQCWGPIQIFHQRNDGGALCLPSLDSGSPWLGPGRDTVSYKAVLISELGMYFFCGLPTRELCGWDCRLEESSLDGWGTGWWSQPGSGSSVLGDGGRSLALSGSCSPVDFSSVCSSAHVGLESTRFPAPCWGLGTKTYQKNSMSQTSMNLEKMVFGALPGSDALEAAKKGSKQTFELTQPGVPGKPGGRGRRFSVAF